MIHSKLKKGKASQLLIQFHKNEQKLPQMIKNFYNVCRDQNLRINKHMGIKQNMIRFYLVKQNSQIQQQQTERQINQSINSENFLKNNITSLQLKLIVIYIYQQNYQVPDFNNFKQLGKYIRVILLRQTLENNFFSLHYEIQNTLSQQQSLMYLCDLAAMLINCQHQSQIQVYDQKKDKMIRKGRQGQNTDLQVIWKNIIYQTPGLGRQKCKAIAEKYPTYQSLIKDYQKNKELKNLLVGKGTKQIKIGSNIAERVYKIFNSLNGKQTFY